MPVSTRRRWLLSLPFAFGLIGVSAAEKPEAGAERPKRKPELSTVRWFTRPAFLTAIAAVIAAAGGIVAATRRASAKS
jgi:hypothetical protein